MLPPPNWPALAHLKGCELQWQMTVLEPEKAAPSWLPDENQMPAPRTNMVVSKKGGGLETPDEMAMQFLEQSRHAIPGLEVFGEPYAFRFDDETTGSAIDIAFEAMPNVRLRQLHVFRTDKTAAGAVQTQFVITKEPGASDQSFNMFLDALKAFVPES